MCTTQIVSEVIVIGICPLTGICWKCIRVIPRSIVTVTVVVDVSELCGVVGKEQVSEPLGKCIEEARVNGVDESQLRQAATLWSDCLFEQNEWERLKETLEFLLELTDESAERLVLRTRLVDICIDGLGELEYACIQLGTLLWTSLRGWSFRL